MFVPLLLAGLALSATAGRSSAQEETEPATFTAAQANTGRAYYEQYCSICHLPDLSGDEGSPLVGNYFARVWGGKPILELINYVGYNMPESDPGSLDPQTVSDIVAYILRENGVLPGGGMLTIDSKGLVPLRAPE